MTTKSTVVDRLSSGLGQLVNVVSSAHPLDHAVHFISAASGPRQHRVFNSSPACATEAADRTVEHAGSETVEEVTSFDAVAVRATFPPGKLHRCVTKSGKLALRLF